MILVLKCRSEMWSDYSQDFEQKHAKFTGVRYLNTKTVTDIEQWLLPEDGRGLSYANYDYQSFPSPVNHVSNLFGSPCTIEPCVRI